MSQNLARRCRDEEEKLDHESCESKAGLGRPFRTEASGT
jgi:hypothetical protein